LLEVVVPSSAWLVLALSLAPLAQDREPCIHAGCGHSTNPFSELTTSSGGSGSRWSSQHCSHMARRSSVVPKAQSTRAECECSTTSFEPATRSSEGKGSKGSSRYYNQRAVMSQDVRWDLGEKLAGSPSPRSCNTTASWQASIQPSSCCNQRCSSGADGVLWHPRTHARREYSTIVSWQETTRHSNCPGRLRSHMVPMLMTRNRGQCAGSTTVSWGLTTQRASLTAQHCSQSETTLSLELPHRPSLHDHNTTPFLLGSIRPSSWKTQHCSLEEGMWWSTERWLLRSTNQAVAETRSGPESSPFHSEGDV